MSLISLLAVLEKYRDMLCDLPGGWEDNAVDTDDKKRIRDVACCVYLSIQGAVEEAYSPDLYPAF